MQSYIHDMAKEKQRKTAHILYVEQNKSQKEIAQLLGVTEKTVSSWVNKYSWKQELTARNASPARRINNIKAIITNLSEERLLLTSEVRQLEKDGASEEATKKREQISRIDDSVSKWNKTLENINKENQVSLSIYLQVMESIFNSMRLYDVNQYMDTVEFQEHHLHKITMELG